MGSSWGTVAVVGAGIAGLTAAVRLQQAGAQVLVVEQQPADRIGGRMASVERDGFHIDLGGPLLARGYRSMLGLIDDVGLASHVLPCADTVCVKHHDAWHRGRTGTVPRLLGSGLLQVAGPRDRARLLMDMRRFRPLMDTVDMSRAARLEESATDYVKRRGLAPDVGTHLLDPLGATMSLAGPDSVTALTPFFMLMLYAGGRGFFTSPTGSGFLPRRLAELVPTKSGTRVLEVVENRESVAVTWRDTAGAEHTRPFDGVVLAVPPPQLAAVAPQLPGPLRQNFAGAVYPRLVQVTYCLDAPTAERAVVVYLSRHELPQVACFVLQHNLSPRRVPTGTAMITTYLRADASDELWLSEDHTIESQVTGAIRQAGLFPELDRHVVARHIDRIWPSVLIRPPGSYRELAALPQWRSRRIVTAGADLRSHSTTIGSLRSGEAAARQLCDMLRRPC